MPWAVVAAAFEASEMNYRPGGIIRVRNVDDFQPLPTPWIGAASRAMPRDEIAEAAAAHRQRMEAQHAETMRHARIVTFLLGAFVLTVGLMVAGVL